jgi:hypothetical protein
MQRGGLFYTFISLVLVKLGYRAWSGTRRSGARIHSIRPCIRGFISTIKQSVVNRMAIGFRLRFSVLLYFTVA